MTHQQSVNHETIDDLLNALANRHCRATVSYFRDSPADVASVRDVATEITKRDHGGVEQMTLELQHSILPMLADVDVIEYDERSLTIRYHGHSELERLMDCIADL